MNVKPASCISDAANSNTRWHIDATTLAVLEKVFSLDQFPNVETRKQLGSELGVSTRQIQVWFQNRRQRERKNRLSGSGLEPMDSKRTTPVSSTDDITTALFEFGTGEKEDVRSLCALPLAPMPRINSPDSGASTPRPGSSPGKRADVNQKGEAQEGSAAPAPSNSCASDGESSEPPSTLEERPLERPESLLSSAQPRNFWPCGTASISSWTPPPSSVPTKGGPALPPRLIPGALQPEQVPNVAAKLAQACQSSLVGRTLQDYGGIVQVITEPRAPYNVLSVSSGWERLTGYTRDEVVGRPLKMLQGAQTESEMVQLLMRGVHEQRPVSVRITNYTKQGVSFVHQLSSEPLRDASGRTQCFQATSLVLRRPGDSDSSEEIAIGQLPMLFHDQVPPLWPLLSRAGPPTFTPAPIYASYPLPTNYTAPLSYLRPPLTNLSAGPSTAAFAAAAAAALAAAPEAAAPAPTKASLPKVPSLGKMPTASEFSMLGGWQEKELLQLLGGTSASDLELVRELDDDVTRDVESALLEQEHSGSSPV